MGCQVHEDCAECIKRCIEWLPGTWRGHREVARCMEGDMEQLLGAQRICKGV